MRRMICLLLCLCVTLALAACGTEPAPTTEPADDPTAGPVTVPTTAPTQPSATAPTEDTTPSTEDPVIYDLPMSAIVLTDHQEAHTDGSGNTLFTYTYQNVRLYLDDETISEAVTLELLNRIDATRTAAEKILAESGSASPDSPYWFTVQYVPERIDSGILSLSGTQSSYSGGSHANSACVGVTYDLLTGSVLGLGDILTDDCTADVICRLVVDALSAVSEEYFLYGDYAVTVEERFSGDFRTDENWYLSGEGLCFSFSPYEVAPYSSGIVTALIPYESLHGVLEDACFPMERISASGTMFCMTAHSADPAQFDQIAEVILDSGSDSYILSTDGLVYDVTIERGIWDPESKTFASDSVVFASDSLIPKNAILLERLADTAVCIYYTSGDTRIGLLLTDSLD